MLNDIASQLKKDRETSLAEAKKLEQIMDAAIIKLKVRFLLSVGIKNSTQKEKTHLKNATFK